nr:hypothetical protein [Tanacetum cinerariifolium]
MSTHSSARNLFPPLDNPELTIRRRPRADPTLLNDFEMAAEGNGDPPLRNEITNFRQRPDESLFEVWWNLHEKASRRCYDLIKNMTAYHKDWDTSAQRSESSSSIASSFDPKIVALKAKMAEINKNLMRVLQVNQQVKAVTPSCETYSGPHSYNDCPATIGQTQNVYVAGAYQAKRSESSTSITSSSDTEITAPKAEMAEINKKLMRVLQVNQQVKAVTPNCETCGGPHAFSDCPATVGQTQNVYVAGAYQGEQEAENGASLLEGMYSIILK